MLTKQVWSGVFCLVELSNRNQLDEIVAALYQSKFVLYHISQYSYLELDELLVICKVIIKGADVD